MCPYKNSYPLFLKLAFIASFTVILPNCASQKTAKVTQGDQSIPLLQQAQAALSNQQLSTAAALFVQLANTKVPPLRNQYLITAVDAYIKAGDLNSANKLINTRLRYSAQLSPINKLVLADILLQQGKTDQTTELLMSLDHGKLTIAQRISLHTLSSSAFFQAGNLLESIHERIALDKLLIQSKEKVDNQTKLIETLSLLSQQTLDFLRPTADVVMAGWIDLSEILKKQAAFAPDSVLINEWKKQHPAHPANDMFFSTLAGQALIDFNPPDSVGVFLPTQGEFAQAANSIRKGISTSATAMQNQWPINIRFYDTSSAPVETLYRQAIDDGIDFIIGPLKRENVSKIAALSSLPIPIIALNKNIAQHSASNHHELSLAPENDVTQTLSLAWLKGYEKALILTPQSRYGERLANHFSTVWQQLGGKVVGTQSYPLKQADYSAPIKRLLLLDESVSRFKKLRQRLNLSLQFEERRRQDADFIFLIAAPREGRLIKPQLRFHRATKLPVFSTSKIYAGTLNKVADRDLDSTFFCDMPWLIEPQNNIDTDFESALKLSPNTHGLYSRLMAFGYDAYQIIPHLKRLKSDNFARFKGKTGLLSIQQNGVINRQLNCGQFKRGEITSLGLAPHLERTFNIPPTYLSKEPIHNKEAPL